MRYYQNNPPVKNLQQVLTITPTPKQREVSPYLWAPFLGNLYPQQKEMRRLCKTLLRPICKILSTEKHDRILGLKRSSLQVQNHNDVHLNDM